MKKVHQFLGVDHELLKSTFAPTKEPTWRPCTLKHAKRCKPSLIQKSANWNRCWGGTSAHGVEMPCNQHAAGRHAPLLLIVGMHRSGTSLLGSLLPNCGIAMPGSLINGDQNNPEGYYERTDISDLQEQLLIDLERWWPSPMESYRCRMNGCKQTPRNQLLNTSVRFWSKNPKNKPQRAIKDPRTSLLLPLWRQVCNELNIPLRLLLAIRDPQEVMVSLMNRDGAYTGMDAWRAQQLWWRHNAQVFMDRGRLPLQVVSYSNWFDPKTVDLQLQQLAPDCSPLQHDQAKAAIRPQHRRSHRQRQPAALHASVKAMYERLHAAALEPEPGAAMLQWLKRHNPPPRNPPAASKRQRLKRWWHQQLHRADQSNNIQHPWAYFASMRIGSNPEAIEDQIKQWLSQGFSADELSMPPTCQAQPTKPLGRCGRTTPPRSSTTTTFNPAKLRPITC